MFRRAAVSGAACGKAGRASARSTSAAATVNPRRSVVANSRKTHKLPESNSLARVGVNAIVADRAAPPRVASVQSEADVAQRSASRMIHVLGIDAGGTKTVCHLADEHGTLIAEARDRGRQPSGGRRAAGREGAARRDGRGDRGAGHRAGGDLPRDCRRRSARRLGGRRGHHAAHWRARAHAGRQRRARGARGGRARRAGRGDHLGNRIDRLRPERATTRARDRAAGGMSSATRGAGSGLAAPRFAPCCARPTGGDPAPR